ncbi:MAG: hypothetical protein HY902_03600 [Deltaproteobacteria bacterium]|nr:hypothetical protein [Deltaproteobacteria bacterium]
MVDGDSKEPPAGPRTHVAIHILDDGRVIFGDLPPELAEVAAILRGDPPEQRPPAAEPAPPDSRAEDCDRDAAAH